MAIACPARRSAAFLPQIGCGFSSRCNPRRFDSVAAVLQSDLWICLFGTCDYLCINVWNTWKFFECVIFIPYQHKCLQLCQCCSWLNKLYNLGRSDPELTWLSWFSIFHKWKSWYATETDLCFNDSSLVQEIDNPEHILWEKFAKILKRWITCTLSKEITCFDVGSKSAFDLWNILKEKLAKASKAREFHLHGELQSNKRDTASSWWVSSQAQNRCRWTRSHRKSFVWGQAKFLAS